MDPNEGALRVPLTSTITQNVQRSDGSRRITEMHVDHLGGKHPIDYTLPVGGDSAVLLSTHASGLLDLLSTIELHEIRNRVELGEDIRSITQEFSRRADLQVIFVTYLADANREKAEATLKQSRIDAANTAIE